MLRRASLTLGIAWAASACAPPMQLARSSAGCYAVRAPWSDDHARVTGFQRLPAVVALDTMYTGRVLVPIEWREADLPAVNFAKLRLESLPWRVEGDSVVLDGYRKPHWLAGDSVIVTFSGWGGWLAVYLAPDAGGFTGTGFLYPRPLAAGLARVPIELRRTECPVGLA